MTSLLLGNVVLLNLLIAIVSDVFDKFSERASVEVCVVVCSSCLPK
eukprot:SAG31_NODE_34078_length_336_cov_4.282700_1_plen_45_part_01